MFSSLYKLVQLHPENQHETMKAMFSTALGENIQLPKQKGYCPFSYVISRAKILDTNLPPQEKWGKTLDCD